MKKPVPIIIDTDIGCDIDDTWALVMALKSPEVDIKLVAVNQDDTVYKAKLVCKMLEIAGRTDIPVAIGPKTSDDYSHIEEWVADYDLSTYPNLIEDGVQGIIDTVMQSDETITIVALGPFKNLADAHERETRIKEKSIILGICANIYNGAFRGMNWHPPLGRESNIWSDLESYRRSVEVEGWPIDLVPLDMTGGTVLQANYYSQIAEAAKTDKLLAALMENCEIWYKRMNFNFVGVSSCLFDTIGIYAAFTHENMNYQRLPIYANDKCITLIDPERGKYMDVALTWDDKEKFYKFLCARLLGEI